MQKRERIHREIMALTAEGRASAIILGLMPVAAAILLYVFAPDYIETLFDEPIGVAAVIASGVLCVIGGFWLRRIVDIEV
jgi:tight adherence protein B